MTWDSYVYFLVHNEIDAFKIGVSVNTPQRMQSLGEKFDLEQSFEITCTGENSYIIEKILHRMFRHHKKDMPQKDGYTEWFHIDCLNAVRSFVETHKDLLGWNSLGKVKIPEKVELSGGVLRGEALRKRKEENKLIRVEENNRCEARNLASASCYQYWIETLHKKGAIVGTFTNNHGNTGIVLKSDVVSCQQIHQMQSSLSWNNFSWTNRGCTVITDSLYSSEHPFCFLTIGAEFISDGKKLFSGYESIDKLRKVFSVIPVAPNMNEIMDVYRDITNETAIMGW